MRADPYGALELGQSREEIVAVIGHPTRVNPKSWMAQGLEKWVYPKRLRLLFDQDGRLVAKYRYLSGPFREKNRPEQ